MATPSMRPVYLPPIGGAITQEIVVAVLNAVRVALPAGDRLRDF